MYRAVVGYNCISVVGCYCMVFAVVCMCMAVVVCMAVVYEGYCCSWAGCKSTSEVFCMVVVDGIWEN